MLDQFGGSRAELPTFMQLGLFALFLLLSLIVITTIGFTCLVVLEFGKFLVHKIKIFSLISESILTIGILGSCYTLLTTFMKS